MGFGRRGFECNRDISTVDRLLGRPEPHDVNEHGSMRGKERTSDVKVRACGAGQIWVCEIQSQKGDLKREESNSNLSRE